MFKIANMTFNTSVRFNGQFASAVFPLDLTNKQLKSIQDAKQIETLSNDDQETVIGQYRLAGWTKVEKMWDGYSVTWQIASEDEVEELRAKTEELELKLEVQGREFAQLIESYQKQLTDLTERLNASEVPEAISEPSESTLVEDNNLPSEEENLPVEEPQTATEEK